MRILSAVLVMFSLGSCAHKNPYYDASKPHHTPEGFQNIYNKFDKPFSDLMKWKKEAKKKNIKGPEEYSFPLLKPDVELLKQPAEKARVTWIGHATLLVQFKDVNILTDPHFTERASPVSWYGPKRAVAPALKVEELPPIDIIVISHDHYDSLDEESVELLSKHHPQAKFFVPLGVDRWLLNEGIPKSQVVGMDWWETKSHKGAEVTATPVQHWCRRSLWDTNERLWAGFAVKMEGFNFYFAGDSGYVPHFREVGKKLGPFDLAAIPIGAYEPRWFMKFAHMNPEESVRVHMDLRARRSIGMHWGTFVLTDEPLDQPPKDLDKALEYMRVPKKSFWVFQHGETRSL